MDSVGTEQISSADTSIWKFLPKQISPYLFVLIVVCLIAFSVEAYFVSKIQFIGTSDPAHYYEVAENVILGKGFVMDYLNQYLYKFDTITHPEEYGFPGVSLLTIPFILLLGKTVFAIKLPSMIIGIILFPILTYYLGKEFFEEKIGFLAAASMIFYPTIFHLSFGGERDTIFSFFVVASIFFFYKGIKLDELKYYLLMGFFIGIAYLIRPAALVLFPVVIIASYLITKNFTKKFFYGLLVAILVSSPWLVRSYMIFGDPLFTINRYAGWIMGYASYFDQTFFRIYWDEPIPSLSLLINTNGLSTFFISFMGRFLRNLSGQFTTFFILNTLTFLGLSLFVQKEYTKKFTKRIVLIVVWGVITFLFAKIAIFGTLLHGILVQPSLISIFIGSLLLTPYLVMLLMLFFIFNKVRAENTIFIVLWCGYASFFALIWVFDIRYWLSIVPFFFVFGWATLEIIIKKISEKVIRPPPTEGQLFKIFFMILIIFILVSVPKTFGNFVTEDAPFPFQDDKNSLLKLQITEKINNLTETGAIIMGCDVGLLHFYANRQFLEFPSESYTDIFNLMKQYNASYFTLLDCARRGIDKQFYDIIYEKEKRLPEDYEDGTIAVLAYDFKSQEILRANIPTKYLLKLYKVDFDTELKNESNTVLVPLITEVN